MNFKMKDKKNNKFSKMKSKRKTKKSTFLYLTKMLRRLTDKNMKSNFKQKKMP